ncbi:MAG: F0F1 ATP synthase subunit delta [Patescibacteria group bacterium]
MKTTPRTYAEALYEAVKAAPEKELPAIMRRMLQVLQQRRHWGMLSKIIRAFDEVLYEREGMIAVTLTSGRAHGPTQEKEWIKYLLDALHPTTGKRSVALERIIDPVLIGGVKLKARGYVYDASVGRWLADLRQKLYSAQV